VYVDADHALDPVRREQRHRPHDQAALSWPAMTAFDFERIEQPGEVTGRDDE
jgi:hypothetical protein